MISAKDYVVNLNAAPEKLPIVRGLTGYATSAPIQEEMATKLSTAPAATAVLSSPVMQSNPALVAPMQQIEPGRPTPIMRQMRQIREGMHGPYQLVMMARSRRREPRG